MITADIVASFEKLWRRPDIYHKDQTYGQSFAQFTKCDPNSSISSFLCNAPYKEVKDWIDGHIKDSKVQAPEGPGNKAGL